MCRGPVWEFAGSDPKQSCALDGAHPYTGFSIPPLIDCCAIPSFDRSYVLDDLLPWTLRRHNRSPSDARAEAANAQADLTSSEALSRI